MAELHPGDAAPGFDLPATDGSRERLDGGGAPATVVVFTCNHCPYALAWEGRLLQAARDFADRGARFLAICSNDADRYPADSFEAMKAHAEQERWPFPYLHDSSQEVARAYGAKVTPDVFVLDAVGTIQYRGAPDAGYRDPSLGAGWLRDALDAVLAGRRPDPAETEPVGCSIKWKPGP